MKQMSGIDLFAGAGGMSLGAELSGIKVKYAVEIDTYAAETYRTNHPNTKIINRDIKRINYKDLSDVEGDVVLFGGPPCQGFSTSNQRTRNRNNKKNWLFQEFVRLAGELNPKWIVFENVKGIMETEHGFFESRIREEFEKIGYTCTVIKPCAAEYGVPQKRTRFFLFGSKDGRIPKMHSNESKTVTVKDALEDLPSLLNGSSEDVLPYLKEARSEYARMLRAGLFECSGHLVSTNAPFVLERYKHIPQGGNWTDIPDELMKNYTDKSRCHTGIYKRLKEDEPAMTVGNYRKSMIIHPWEDRGLSVREAARLQSFPDSYKFCGSIGFQQQQVGNAVPPLLAKAAFDAILKAESIGSSDEPTL